MGRAPCCAKVGLKRGRWTAEEDEMLVKYIAANGEGSWRTLPKNAGLLRCGKSCRLRWINYLRAGVKRGDISKEEEETILKLHASMGNRWSLIASHLPGRTDNEIKNYWNSHLGRRVHSFRRIEVDGAPSVVVDVGKAASSGKQRGGRTSRSAMKKKSTGVSTDRRVKQEKGAAVLPTSSSVHSDLGCSMVFDLGYQQENCVTLEGLDGGMLCPSGETEAGLMSPSQVRGSGLWPINDMERVLFHASEDSVGWGSHEERESGVMSSSEERELGGLAFNGGRDGGPLALEGGCGVALGEEEVGSAQVGKMLDWDMGLGAKLWDDEGQMWPWPWESENVGLELQGMEGSGPKEESLASWLLF